ncbi:hypothetical protein DRO69_12795, partial [Candidatus Bathyarchaeota archaeon]
MNNMRKNLILLLIFLSSTLFLNVTINMADIISLAISNTTIEVDPSTSTAEIGETFSIDIKITDVIDLYGWEFKLKWNKTILDPLNVIEGTFLKNNGDTYFINKINKTLGYMLVDCTLLGNIPGVSGTGILATVEFSVNGHGECSLDLYDTKLVSSLEEAIVHMTNDGSFITLTPSFHDISVTNVKLSKNVVAVGGILRINITDENLGGYNETYDLTIQANKNITVGGDEILIKTQTVESLSAQSSSILTISWNTTGVPRGNYTICGQANTVTDETNTTNNFCIGGTISVTLLLGDINADDAVNIIDIFIIAKAFVTTPGHPRWNPNADLNDDL